MKRRALFLLGWSILTGCSSRSTDEWVKVPVKDGSFTAEMPGEPKLTETKIARTDGDVNVSTYTYQNPAARYRLVVMGLPKPPADPDAELEPAAKDLIDSTSKPDRDERTSIGGLPARIVEMTNRNGEPLFARLILAGDRLYILVATYSRTAIKKNVAERAARFFDSFSVTL